MKTFLFQRFFIEDKLHLAYFCQSLPFQYELIEKNSFDSSRYPAVSNLFYSNKVGLLTCPCLLRLPSILPVADECNKPQKKDSQQQVLFRIRTEFPFHSFGKNSARTPNCEGKGMLYILFDEKNIVFFVILELF